MTTDRIGQLLNSIATGEYAFSGRAIPLDDPESCWIVLSGALDLFSARMMPDGSCGARLPAGTGDCPLHCVIPGVAAVADGEGRRILLAMPLPGTRCVKVPSAALEALCRRVHRAESEEERDPAKELGTLTSGDFVLDENRRVLLKAGQPIELTQVEFQIMELFFRNPGIALVREKILKGVWGENYFGDVKIVDVNIRRLRMKVEDEPSHPTHIMTVWGYGYRWEE